MKYIFTNIKKFIQNEKTIFILIVLSIFSTAIIFNFVFGFYHHLRIKKMEGGSYPSYFTIHFEDPNRRTVTKGSMLELLLNMDSDVFENCRIRIEGRFLEDKTDLAPLDNTMLVLLLTFCIEDGELKVVPNYEEQLRENNYLVEGHYFTEEQFDNAEFVCLAPRPDVVYGEEGSEERKWAEKYAPNPDGTYTIGGKDYVCIGYTEQFAIIPEVPITTVSDDIYVKDIAFDYGDNIVTKKSYTAICDKMRQAYGDMAHIPELGIPDIDSLRFYNSLILICVLLVVMSGTILSMLFQYVFLQRRRQLLIYRICGMTQRKAKLLYFVECLVITMVVYVCGVCLFEYGLLPYLNSYFEYMADSYVLSSYIKLGAIYIGISSVILYLTICRELRHSILTDLKGA